MKKMVFMAAFVAACAAFVACSNENDLVQQKPDVPEETVVKYPMTITVSDPTSRGTDFTATSLRDFTLYSTLGPTWVNGAAFSKDVNDKWVNVYSADMSWGEDPDKSYSFYGVNDVANLAIVSTVTQKPTVQESTVKFSYAMPQTLKPKFDAANVDSFCVNYDDQVDLLVTKLEASYNSGTPKGALNVTFDHALAQITKVKVYCSANRMTTISGRNAETDVPTWRFRINGMRLGGLKASGTYTFGETTPWSVLDPDEEVEFEIPLVIPTDDEQAFEAMSFQPGTRENAKEFTLKDGGLYLIPQVANGQLVKSGSVYNIVGPYVEFDAQIGHLINVSDPDNFYWDYAENEDDPMDWNYEDSKIAGFRHIRIPLKFDITAGSGKGYTLVLDISNAIIWDDSSAGRGQYDSILGSGITIKLG